MANQDPLEPPTLLSFKDFLSQLAGLSFDVYPQLDEIQEILSRAEARESRFAARLAFLKEQLLNFEPGDQRRGRLTSREEEMVEVITLYQTIAAEKEKASLLQNRVADNIVVDLLNQLGANSNPLTPLPQDPEPDLHTTTSN